MHLGSKDGGTAAVGGCNWLWICLAYDVQEISGSFFFFTSSELFFFRSQLEQVLGNKHLNPFSSKGGIPACNSLLCLRHISCQILKIRAGLKTSCQNLRLPLYQTENPDRCFQDVSIIPNISQHIPIYPTIYIPWYPYDTPWYQKIHPLDIQKRHPWYSIRVLLYPKGKDVNRLWLLVWNMFYLSISWESNHLNWHSFFFRGFCLFPKSFLTKWDFPWTKPSSSPGYPHGYGHPHIYLVNPHYPPI